MTLRAEFSLGHSKFNDFLFAVVGEERNGMQLTVLTTLARLGIDPWGEAARLAKLPRETASVALGRVIAELPTGNWTMADVPLMATRLIDRLPSRGAAASNLKESS